MLLLCDRNQDFQEVTIELPGIPLLRFAKAYGFRNIQNIVPKVKRGMLPYDFVEVMACPSGWYTDSVCEKTAVAIQLIKFALLFSDWKNAIKCCCMKCCCKKHGELAG